jgi:transketolase
MGLARAAFELWDRHLRFDPTDPAWPLRDRFVLSNGHASMLLYSLLHLYGYDLSLEDIQAFRQLHSKTPGHPEYGDTPGVEMTTGPPPFTKLVTPRAHTLGNVGIAGLYLR